jgi:hypothetical protein
MNLKSKFATILMVLSLLPAGGALAQTPQKSPASQAGQYKTEEDAKAHCSGDAVVWVNTSSKVYHYAGTKAYGKTKRGGYACEKEASTGGFRAAKGEKRPS